MLTRQIKSPRFLAAFRAQRGWRAARGRSGAGQPGAEPFGSLIRRLAAASHRHAITLAPNETGANHHTGTPMSRNSGTRQEHRS